MATTQKDLLSRLADAGEDAIKRLGEIPGTKGMLDTANALRARVDELQKRVRGLDVLEQRVNALEKRIAKLEKPAAAKPKTVAKKAAPRKKPTS